MGLDDEPNTISYEINPTSIDSMLEDIEQEH